MVEIKIRLIDSRISTKLKQCYTVGTQIFVVFKRNKISLAFNFIIS